MLKHADTEMKLKKIDSFLSKDSHDPKFSNSKDGYSTVNYSFAENLKSRFRKTDSVKYQSNKKWNDGKRFTAIPGNNDLYDPNDPHI